MYRWAACFFVAKKCQKINRTFWPPFLWSMGFFCFGVSWLNVSIHQFGGASLGVSYLLVGLLSAYLALYPMLFTYLVQRFQVQSAVIFAAIWTLTEFLRGWVFYRFSLVTIWLYPNRQSIFRHRANLWCHGADILYCLGKCGHF